MKKYKIGILGGMGPEASKEAYERVIKYAQENYNAVQDNEFPNIVIYNLGLDGFDETGITNLQTVKTQVLEGLDLLHNSGCQAILIACNTVHVVLDDIDPKYNLIHMIKNVSQETSKHNYSKVGLICSQTTNNTQLYQNHIQQNGAQILTLKESEQIEINKIIKNILEGSKENQDIAYIQNLIHKFKKQGAQAIILGCTELPLLVNNSKSPLPILDSLQIGIEQLTNYYYNCL